MQLVCLLGVLLITLVNAWPDPPCRTPPPAANYTIEKYSGRWFEIGKIQTAGGAFFQKDCVCTHLDVAPTVDDPSIVIVSNTCNKKTPDGQLLVANGSLTSTMQPSDGRYNETIAYTKRPTSYNIIVLKTDDYTVEYDCMEELGLTNYCIHILSRKNTLDTSTVNKLVKFAVELNLNPNKLEFVMTKHQNCIYP